MADDQQKRVPGPDQASGWLIAMACFGINFVMAGLARTAGVLYVALIELYGVSREAATTPFSLRVCVRNMTGPLIGLLGLRYGIRAVSVAGAAIAAFGSVLCYFAPSVAWITVFWGAIHGFGFGLGTVLHMMVINQYFDKYKASALGLGYSGDCFGTFAFPVIMEYLLAHYGVKGTFLILGGIVLNVVPMAMLLRKPPWLRSKKKKAKEIEEKKEKEAMNGEYYENDAYIHFEEDLSPVKEHGVVSVRSTKNRVSSVRGELPSSNNGSVRSHRKDISEFIRENMERHGSLPPVLEKKESIPGEGTFETVSLDNHDDDDHHEGGVQYSSSMKKRRTSSFVGEIMHRMRSASFASQVAQDGFIANLQPEEEEVDEGPSKRRLSLDEAGRCKNCGQVVTIVPPATEGDDVQSTHEYVPPPRTVLETLVRTNTKPIFVLISVSMAVYVFLFVGVITIIIDYAVDQGVPHERGKFLVIGFSVADLCGRLGFGQVIDRKLIKMKNYSGVTMLLMGTLVAAVPLNTSFNYMMVCMCMYGLVQGGTAIMFPILIGQYMEKNEESVAMGCSNFYGGLLMLGLAPMIGYFRDTTGSYNWVFHIQGGLVALVGIIWQTEPLILRWQRKRQLLQTKSSASHH